MAEGGVCDVFRSLTCSDDKKKTTLSLLELIHLRFHFFTLSFPSFPRCIPLPLEPASIIVTLSAFNFHRSPSVSNLLLPSNLQFPFPSYPLQLPFSTPTPTNQPPSPPFHPSCPRKSYSSQRPTPRPQSIPAPNSPHSIPHFNPTPSLLKHTHSPTLGRKEKKGKARRDAEA